MAPRALPQIASYLLDININRMQISFHKYFQSLKASILIFSHKADRRFRSAALTFPIALWCLLVAIEILGVIDIAGYNIMRNNSLYFNIGLFCFAIFKATFLSWLYALAKGIKWLRVLFILFFAGLGLLALINALCFTFYGFGISRKLIFIMLETTPAETAGFMPQFFSNFHSLLFSWKSLAIVAFIGLCLILKQIPRRLFNITAWSVSALGVIYSAVYGIGSLGKIQSFPSCTHHGISEFGLLQS